MDSEEYLHFPPPSPRGPTRLRRRVDQRARRLKRELIVAAPHLAKRSFAPVVLSFAQNTIIKQKVYELLMEKGLVDGEGEIRSAAIATFSGLAATQLRLSKALLITPDSLSQLHGNEPEDLAALFARHVRDNANVSDAEVTPEESHGKTK